MSEWTLEKKRLSTPKLEWIDRMMQEFHNVPEETVEAEVIDIAPVIAAKTAPKLPPSDGNWLDNLQVGTTFLTTKKALVNEPELIKATIINKTPLSTQLMIDIPGNNATIVAYYNTLTFSNRYIHMDTL